LPAQFNESKLIASSSYNLFVCGIVIVPLVYFLGSDSNFLLGRVLLQAMGILWCSAFNVLALVGPKLLTLWRQYHHQHRQQQRDKHAQVQMQNQVHKMDGSPASGFGPRTGGNEVKGGGYITSSFLQPPPPQPMHGADGQVRAPGTLPGRPSAHGVSALPAAGSAQTVRSLNPRSGARSMGGADDDLDRGVGAVGGIASSRNALQSPRVVLGEDLILAGGGVLSASGARSRAYAGVGDMASSSPASPRAPVPFPISVNPNLPAGSMSNALRTAGVPPSSSGRRATAPRIRAPPSFVLAAREAERRSSAAATAAAAAAATAATGTPTTTTTAHPSALTSLTSPSLRADASAIELDSVNHLRYYVSSDDVVALAPAAPAPAPAPPAAHSRRSSSRLPPPPLSAIAVAVPLPSSSSDGAGVDDIDLLSPTRRPSSPSAPVTTGTSMSPEVGVGLDAEQPPSPSPPAQQVQPPQTPDHSSAGLPGAIGSSVHTRAGTLPLAHRLYIHHAAPTSQP